MVTKMKQRPLSVYYNMAEDVEIEIFRNELVRSLSNLPYEEEAPLCSFQVSNRGIEGTWFLHGQRYQE